MQMLPLEVGKLLPQLHCTAQLRAFRFQQAKLRHQNACPSNKLVGNFGETLCSLDEGLFVSADLSPDLLQSSPGVGSFGVQGLVVLQGMGPAILLFL